MRNPLQQTTDPLFLLKVCRFDLENGPVHLKASKTIQFWSLAAYTQTGTIFYSLNDRTAPDATLDLIIGKPIQIIELKNQNLKIMEMQFWLLKIWIKVLHSYASLPPLSLLRKKRSLFSSATCHILNQ